MSQHAVSSLSVTGLTAPVAMGYIPIGIVFGFLFVHAGGPGWFALLCSFAVYAGAAQLMMIPMLAAGQSVGAIGLAVLIINFRHVFYGLSLLRDLPGSRWQRFYAIFALTDETYSVLSALPIGARASRMALVAALNQMWWLLGTAIGVVFGSQARIDLPGLGFILCALFAVLAVEQWRTRRDISAILIALGGFALGMIVMPSHALVIALGITVVAAVLRPVSMPDGEPT